MEEKDFCCKLIYKSIAIYKTISYDQLVRYFGLHYKTSNGIECVTHLSYCPFCGAKLQKELVDEIFYTLKNDYGIEHPDIWEFTNVPEEFKTDEWWKKRGYDQPYVNNNTPEAIKIKVALPQIKNPRDSLYHSVHFADPLNEGDPYKRVSVDEDSHFVVFVHEEITKDGEMIFTGYVCGWDEYDILGKKIPGLNNEMKEALYKAGAVLNMQGEINPEFIKKLKELALPKDNK